MRPLRFVAVLSAWLCVSGSTSRGVDAPPPPETGMHQHNSFAGMDGLITTELNRDGAQQGIAERLKEALEQRYLSHRFATVTYDFLAVENLLSSGDRSGAITGPENCDQAGVDPPWDTCRGGGSLLRSFVGARDAQGQPTLKRTAVVFWWPATEVAQVQGRIAQATRDFDQYLKSVWWDKLRDKESVVWIACARGGTVPVDVTVMASCFTQKYARYARMSQNQLPKARGFLVAPEQANYDFSSGHIFMLNAAIRAGIPKGPYGKRSRNTQIKLLLAALL